MSATFIVKFRGQSVQFNELTAGRTRYSLVCDDEATPYTSAVEAWMACMDYKLDSRECEVVSL